MKRLTYLIILVFLFISCKKNEQASALVGQWEWFKATGGIGNIYQTPQNSGFSWQLKLNADYTSEQTGDLMLNGNGTYTLTDDTEPGSSKKLLNITTNGVTQTFSYSFVSRDTLRLDQNVEADGLSYFLVRE